MVVGRRRVAAASVATAYALHVYVLPNTIFDRPKPAIPPLSTHPHCPKVRMHSCSGYFSWVLVPRSFLSIFATLPLHPCRLSRSSISRPLHPPSGYTYTFRIRILSLLATATCRETTRLSLPLTLVYPRLFTHCSHSFSFAPAFYLFCSYYSLVSRSRTTPYTRIETVYIVLRSVSKLRENDRLAERSLARMPLSLSFVVFHPCSFISRSFSRIWKFRVILETRASRYDWQVDKVMMQCKKWRISGSSLKPMVMSRIFISSYVLLFRVSQHLLRVPRHSKPAKRIEFLTFFDTFRFRTSILNNSQL